MLAEKRTALGLFLMRAGVALFMAQWALEKLIRSENTAFLYEQFYGFNAGPSVVFGMGIAQMAIVLLFAMGLFKRLTYGMMMVMHGTTVVMTLGALADPFTGLNGLFAASVPALAAMAALYLMRDQDRLFILSRQREAVIDG